MKFNTLKSCKGVLTGGFLTQHRSPLFLRVWFLEPNDLQLSSSLGRLKSIFICFSVFFLIKLWGCGAVKSVMTHFYGRAASRNVCFCETAGVGSPSSGGKKSFSVLLFLEEIILHSSAQTVPLGLDTGEDLRESAGTLQTGAKKKKKRHWHGTEINSGGIRSDHSRTRPCLSSELCNSPLLVCWFAQSPLL